MTSNEGHQILTLKKITTDFICSNCRGLKNKQDEIRDMISDHRPTIFCCARNLFKKKCKKLNFVLQLFQKEFPSF